MKSLNFIKQLYSRHPNYFALGVFALLIAIFYGNTLFNGFVLDDRLLIEGNSSLQSIQNFPKLLGGCPTESSSDSCQLFYYRPLLHVWNVLLYQISPEPWVFHLGNLLAFLGTVLVVFLFVKALSRSFLVSLFAAILFLVNPRNAEVVNWPSAVGELFLIFFMLLSLLLYMRWREAESSKNLVLASLSYFLAMLAKEPAFFLVPILILALNVFVFRVPFKSIAREAKRHVMLAIPLVVYGVIRFIVLNGLGKPGLDPGPIGAFGLGERLYGSVVLLGEYARSVILPYPLLFFHDVQRNFDFFHLQFLFGVLVLLAVPVLLYVMRKQGAGLPTFFLFWLFLFYVPIFLLFQIVGKAGENVFVERYLLAPSIAYALLLSYGIMFFHSKTKKRGATVLVVGVLCVLSWAVVVPRNGAWRDNIALFQTTLAQTPYAHHIRELLADELRGKGDFEGAKREYEFIIAQGEGYRGLASVENSLGSIYRDEENYEKAEELYRSAAAVSEGKDYRIYNNLGVLYVQQNQHLRALVNFCQALKINPEAQEPQQNFNRIASSVYSVQDSEFVFLYQDVMFGGAFSSSGDKLFTWKKKSCAYGTCLHTFTPSLEQGEVLLPFLIMATAFPQEVIRVRSSEFYPSSNEVVLAIDEKYQDRLLTFTFPVCSGTRYDVEVTPS